MRIEERCGCGGALAIEFEQILEPRTVMQQGRNATMEMDAWKQIKAWRKQHAGCVEDEETKRIREAARQTIGAYMSADDTALGAAITVLERACGFQQQEGG